MNDELLINHTYLLKYRNINNLSQVKVLNITNTAYQLHWYNGSDTWESKEHLLDDYKVIEDISDFIQDKNENDLPHIDKILHAKTKWIQCPVCDGTGNILNQESTSGFITCPNCFGSKMILSVSEISE